MALGRAVSIFSGCIRKPDAGLLRGDCAEIVGDVIIRVVTWKGKPDLANLAGPPIRMRSLLKDVDLHSFRFPRA